MDVVIRPVNGRFLEEVAFPAFEAGVLDATAGLTALAEKLRDEQVGISIEQMLQRGVQGSFYSLGEDRWLETVYRVLFWEWLHHPDGWTLSNEYFGFAGDWEQTLHLCLMLEDPVYPYRDEAAAEKRRREFLEIPANAFGLSALVAGLWDPFPAFPPDQVLATAGHAAYQPDAGLAIADWSWRPASVVATWAAALPDKFAALLARETRRLHPVEAPETRDLLAYWLGKSEFPPLLAVCFSGLGRDASEWIRGIGAIGRTIRSAAALEQGFTAVVTQAGRAMADGASGGTAAEAYDDP